MMAKPIELAWQPELADYVEAYRARNRARRAQLKIAICAGVVLVVGLLGVAIGQPTLIGAGGGALIALLLVVFVLQPRAVRNLWRRNPAVRAPATARVDPDAGLTTSNGATTGQIQWSGIDSLLETERLFVIQLAGYRRKPFIVLAKRGLTDPDEIDDLRALLTVRAT
jgi:hypothetical protein